MLDPYMIHSTIYLIKDMHFRTRYLKIMIFMLPIFNLLFLNIIVFLEQLDQFLEIRRA